MPKFHHLLIKDSCPGFPDSLLQKLSENVVLPCSPVLPRSTLYSCGQRRHRSDKGRLDQRQRPGEASHSSGIQMVIGPRLIYTTVLARETHTRTRRKVDRDQRSMWNGHTMTHARARNQTKYWQYHPRHCSVHDLPDHQPRLSPDGVCTDSTRGGGSVCRCSYASWQAVCVSSVLICR